MKEANKFLEEYFIPKFNVKFMVEPRTNANLHKKLTKQEVNKLDSIFSKQYQKTVRNDFTITHDKNYYQLTDNQLVTICKQDKVIVEERMDKSVHFRLRGKYLNYKLLPEKPKKINADKVNWVIHKTTAHKPADNHPWRQIAKLEYLKKLTKVSK